MNNAVTDRSFNPSNSEKVDALKAAALAYEEAIRANTPAGRHQSVALTHLETASMWAVKSLFV